MKKVKSPSPKKDRKILTFFLIMFPSIVLAASQNLLVQVAMVAYQAILLKQFLDDYYTPYNNLS